MAARLASDETCGTILAGERIASASPSGQCRVKDAVFDTDALSPAEQDRVTFDEGDR